MFSSKLNLLLCLTVVAVSATPTPLQRDIVETRQFNVTLHNQLPVQGTLPFGITITKGAANSTVGIPAGFPFKRDDEVLEARQFNFTLPNQLPVEGDFPFGIKIFKGAKNSTIELPAGFPFNLKRDDETIEARQFNVTLPNQLPVVGTLPFVLKVFKGAKNSTIEIPAGFPFKRDDEALEARQFNFTLPNQLPVEGTLPFGIKIFKGAKNSTIELPAGFPFNLKRDDETIEARQFNVTLPNQLPVVGTLPFGLKVFKGAKNSTIEIPAGFPFKRDDATPVLAAREPAFSANIPNNVPVSGTFPNGITITPQTPSGSIVTGNNNSTLFGFLGFKRDE